MFEGSQSVLLYCGGPSRLLKPRCQSSLSSPGQEQLPVSAGPSPRARGWARCPAGGSSPGAAQGSPALRDLGAQSEQTQPLVPPSCWEGAGEPAASTDHLGSGPGAGHPEARVLCGGWLGIGPYKCPSGSARPVFCSPAGWWLSSAWHRDLPPAQACGVAASDTLDASGCPSNSGLLRARASLALH